MMTLQQQIQVLHHRHHTVVDARLTVGFLVSGTGSWTTELLGLASSGVSHQQAPVELDQGVLDGLLALFVNVLLVEGDEGLGEGLTDSVDLGDATATLDANPNVDVGELVLAEEQDWLLQLLLECLRLNFGQGLAVDSDLALAALAVSHGGSGLLAAKDLH